MVVLSLLIGMGPTPAFAEKSPRRSAFWLPLGSYFVPSLGQWVHLDFPNGAAYAGLAVGGLGLALGRQGGRLDRGGLTSKDNDDRLTMLGLHMYSVAGGLSAYQTFRDAVSVLKPEGKYVFLEKQESVGEILLAPVSVGYVMRLTTALPLLILGGAIVAEVLLSKHVRSLPLTGSDFFFAGAFSYGAGTNEEAVFRGWFMPVLSESWGSPFWANVTQSLVFAALHINPAEGYYVPWPQLLFGFYVGYLTQHRDWTLSEGVFLHTWWDVIAFLSAYAFDNQIRNGTKRARLYVPMIDLRF